eukprot:scaffold53_cov193-Pinguiococcus_pyrenoidosus.AAC.7
MCKLQRPAEHPRRRNTRSVTEDAAYIHALGDLVQSMGVMLAGAICWAKPDWAVVDPLCTILFAIIVLYTTYQVSSATLRILLEGAPVGFSYNDLKVEPRLTRLSLNLVLRSRTFSSTARPCKYPRRRECPLLTRVGA